MNKWMPLYGTDYRIRVGDRLSYHGDANVTVREVREADAVLHIRGRVAPFTHVSIAHWCQLEISHFTELELLVLFGVDTPT